MAEPKVRFTRENGSEYPIWRKKRLRDVCSLVGERGRGSGYLGTENMLPDFAGVDFSSERLGNGTVFGIGDVLISNIRPYLKKTWKADKSGVCSTDILVFHANNVTEGYLYQIISNDSFIKYVMSAAKGSKMPRGDKDHMLDMELFVPCLEEQQKIADFLSSVDDVISTSEQEVTNLETQKKAVMKKIFSQEVRFKRADRSDFPEWEQKYLGDVVGNITSVKRIHAEDWRDSGIPFYRAREIVALYNKEPISPLFIDEELYENFSAVSGKIQPGDLLVTGVGTIGVPYLVKHGDKFYFKDGNIIWIQNNGNIDGPFLYALYGTPDLMNQLIIMSGKGTVHTYTIENAKKTVIPVPCLEEQRLIADFLSDFDEAIAAAKKELELWKELKKGLLQQMLV